MRGNLPYEAQVTPRLRRIAIVWIVGIVLVSAASFAGGDTAVLAGWLYLVWTVPFGVIWWFYLYDHALALLPASVVQPIGVVVVDIVAFLFWFNVIPRLNTALTRRRLSSRSVGQAHD
jgi:uncharacterized membrane protein